MANDAREQEEAGAAGADVVLLKGTSPTKLVVALVRLLPQREDREVTSVRVREKKVMGQRRFRKPQSVTLWPDGGVSLG
jgi:hypothetical protein